jgi:protein gp37
MGDKTKIDWTDATLNVSKGCTKDDDSSPACDHCYAEVMAKRLKAMGVKGYETGFKPGIIPHAIEKGLRWKKPRRIFITSMGDLFHRHIPCDYIAAVFGMMAATQWHMYQILTKRSARMLEFFDWLAGGRSKPVDIVLEHLDHRLERNGRTKKEIMQLVDAQDKIAWPLPNVEVGVTAENQEQLDRRIWDLRNTPAAMHFLSIEPMLGPMDIRKHLWLVCESWPAKYRSAKDARNAGAKVKRSPQKLMLSDVAATLIDWVIVGGESGPHARPMHPMWVQDIRDQCVESNTPFLFKAWGEWLPDSQRHEVDVSFAHRIGFVDHAGRMDELCDPSDGITENPPWQKLWRVGKKEAGAMLDGREWKELPHPR